MLKSWKKDWIICCPDWPHRWQASSHKEPCCQCDLRHNTRTCGSWLASDKARSDTLKTSDTPLLDQLSALNDRMQLTSQHRTLWERACSRRGPIRHHKNRLLDQLIDLNDRQQHRHHNHQHHPAHHHNHQRLQQRGHAHCPPFDITRQGLRRTLKHRWQ